jgi:hypothetical protein
MTPKTADRLVAVRVDADATIVAVVARDSSRVLRVRRVPGGFAAIDGRLLALVDAEVPGGLPRSSEPRVLAARCRLLDAIAAARVRLLDEESTLIPVRFPGRMSFATLEREAAAEAAAPEVEAAAEAVRELADGARIVALDGVATAPGLLEALPGSLVEVGEVDAAALDALLDAAPEEDEGEAVAETEPEPEVAAEPEPVAKPDPEPIAEPEPVVVAVPEPAPVVVAPPAPTPTPPAALPRAVVVLARAWPVAAATASILVLGGAAAALGYTTHQPARLVVERTAPAAPSSAVPSPSPTSAGGAAVAPADPDSPDTVPPAAGAPTVTSPRSPARPGQTVAVAPAPGGGAPSAGDPGTPSSPSSSPSSTPSDTSSPSPTPSDTDTSSPSPSPSDSDTPTPSDSPTDGITIPLPIIPITLP